MPASGYELGMGEFMLPSALIYLIGFALVCLAGWAVSRMERRAAMRGRSTNRVHHEKETPERVPHDT